MGVKATDFGSILIEQRVGFRGEFKFPETFLPTKLVGEGLFGRNADDNFGYSVGIDGDLAVVGVPSQDYDENGDNSLAEAGAVFVYRRTRNSWEFAYKIVCDDREAADNFGYSVSLSGSTLVVGSPARAIGVALETPVIGAGAAFVYAIDSESAVLEGTLLPQVRDENTNFGFTVSAGENTVFVGSHLNGRNELDQADKPAAGAVWAFTRSAEAVWTLTKKIVAGGNERNSGDNFGQAVGAHKNILVVGVPHYDYKSKGTDLQPNAGIAYAYDWNTDHWEFNSTIVAPDRAAEDLFGSSVNVFDGRIAIGAPGKNSNTGKVYLFTTDALGAFAVVAQLEPTVLELPVEFTQPTGPEYTADARFGSAVSLNADTLVVGAPGQAGLNMSSFDDQVNPYSWVGTPLADVGFTYVYTLDVDANATLADKLSAADHLDDLLAPRTAGQFGFSASIGTNILVVGEPYASRDANDLTTDAKTDAGLAHIFELNAGHYSWTKTIDGFYKERNADDFFASSFAQNDRFMVFGAPGQDYDANHENFLDSAGAAYVWENVGGTWVFRQKLAAGNRSNGAQFGRNVALNGDRVLVGSLGTSDEGAVYVFGFVGGKFVETQQIVRPSANTGTHFGSVFTAKESRLAIASTNWNIPGVGAHGAVFVYDFDAASGLYQFDTTLVPSTEQLAGSLFGTSIAMDANVVVIGAPGQTKNAADLVPLTAAGAAYIFAKVDSTWSQIDKIAGPGDERAANDFMGFATASNSTYLAVGVPGSDYDKALSGFRDNAGKVLLYKRVADVWELSTTLYSPNRATNGRFGTSIGMSETTLVVGAPGETVTTYSTGWGDGAAYVFELQGTEWLPTGTLTNAESLSGHVGPLRRFGWSVAVDGSRVIVGEPFNSMNMANATPLSGAGAAWIFEKVGSAWTSIAKLTQDDLGARTAGANFGFSVDLKGTLAIVGAPYDTTNSSGGASLANAGSVCLFRRSETQAGSVSWSAEKKLAGWQQDRNIDDVFGTTIAAYGNTVIIAATGHDYDSKADNFVNNAGAVFVYEWSNNALVYKQKLVAHDQADRIANTGFGTALAVDATHIVISAPLLGKLGNGTPIARQVGKVWSYKLENGLWVNERSFVPSDINESSNGNVNCNTRFGSSLALVDGVLAIGAPGAWHGNNQTALSQSGAVEVYRYNVDGWDFDQIITPTNREANDAFGTTVVVRDNLLVAGGTALTNSWPSEVNANAAVGGAAWIFTYDTNWHPVNKIIRGGVDSLADEQFGISVSVSGSYMVVGSPYHSFDENVTTSVVQAGAAYVFMLVNGYWQFTKKLVAPEASRIANARFGVSVSISGDVIWVGASGEVASSSQGAAYVFRKNPSVTGPRKVRRSARIAPTGASQNFVVPEGVTQITTYLWGASGNNTGGGTVSGNGGFVRATFNVDAGETLIVNVGTKPTGNGAGGGRSEILRGASTLVVAGGGGGRGIIGSGAVTGFAGGAGEDAYAGNPNVLPGLGATQTNGGAARSSVGFDAGLAGSFKQGGNAPATGTVAAGGWPNGGSSVIKGTEYLISGGGDGWYGGSAGAAQTGQLRLSVSGGGGSSYLAPGITGFMSTVKNEYDESYSISNFLGSRPGFNSDGYVVVEWFETYAWEDWSFEQRLSIVDLPVPTNSARFGATIDFDGTTAVVGAPGYRYNSVGGGGSGELGTVLVYEFNGFEWIKDTQLFQFGPQISTAGSNYANSLSVGEEYIVVGAPNYTYDASGENPLTNAGLAFVYKKIAGVWTEWQRLAPKGDSRVAGDRIGDAIAYDGDYVVVGSPGHDFDLRGGAPLSNAGAVYVWKWNGSAITQVQKLVAPEGSRITEGKYGSSLVFSDGMILVGAPGSDGKVFAYELVGETWSLTQELDLPGSTGFGKAITRSGTTLAVGATGGNGAVGVFELVADVWEYSSTIVPTGTNASNSGDAFGTTIAFVDNFMIVGAPSHGYDQDGRNILANAGASWFFELIGEEWVQQQKIVAWGHDLVNNDQTGYEVAAADTIIAVGSPQHPYDAQGNNFLAGAGAVYVWRFTTSWILEQKITAPLRSAGANFGSALALNERTLVVGAASSDSTAGTSTGAVFVFEKAEGSSALYAWNDGYELIPTGTNAQNLNDQFGFAVALNGLNEIIVGAPGNAYDESGSNVLAGAGSAYVFKRDGLDWLMDQKLVAGTMHLGIAGTAPTAGRNAGDSFGYTVAAESNSLIVGAPTRSVDARGLRSLANAGAAIAFGRADSSSAYEQLQFLIGKNQIVESGTRFGTSTSGDGDYFVVGSINDSYDAAEDFYLASSGAAYVWFFDGVDWTFVQKLTSNTDVGMPRNAGANYGESVALVGTRLFVGAPGQTVGAVAFHGAVFVYELVDGLFVRVQNLIPNTTTLTDRAVGFGYAVDFDGTTLIVGAPTHEHIISTQPNFGAAYLYEYDTDAFVQVGMFQDDDTTNGTPRGVGYSVSVKDDVAVAGGPNFETNTGIALVARRTTGVWAVEDRLVSARPVRAFGDQFAQASALEGDILIVGAPTHGYDQLGRDKLDGGAAYVFERNLDVWSFTQKLAPSGLNAHNSGDQFGFAVAISDGLIAVGSPYHAYNNEGIAAEANTGAIFTFTKDVNGHWYQQAKISPQGDTNPLVQQLFGYSIVLDHTTLVTGAPWYSFPVENSTNTNTLSASGIVYIYKLVEDAWFFVDRLSAEGIGSRVANAQFGKTIAYKDGYLAVGSATHTTDPNNNTALTGAGAVWVWNIESLDNLLVSINGGNYVTRAIAQIDYDAGTFAGVSLVNQGSGYRDTPALIFNNPNFAGYVLMDPVAVSSISLLNYTLNPIETPTVEIVTDPLDLTGGGATAEVVRLGSSIVAVNVDYGGTGYFEAPTVTASAGTGVVLEAVLAPTGISDLTLTATGSGYVVMPTVTFVPEPEAGGSAPTTSIVMETETLTIATTDRSYVGEEFTLDFDTTPVSFSTASVDLDRNITAISVVAPGKFTELSSFTALSTERIVDTVSYGTITEDAGSSSEDYGLMSGSTTSSEDWGLTTEPVTSTEDYSATLGGLVYNSITEAADEFYDYGPIYTSRLTLDVKAKVFSLDYVTPGSGYRVAPAVSIDGTSDIPATATTILASTSVESVTVINGGINVGATPSISFSGANTTPAMATAFTQPGSINGITLLTPGSNYTRTPKLVFSDPSFTGKLLLEPTRVASIEVTDFDDTLTIAGNAVFKKMLVAPTTPRRENEFFGTAVDAHGSTVVVGSPRTAAIQATQGEEVTGSVLVYDIETLENDRPEKIDVDGWLDGSSVLADIDNTFTLSMWYKTNELQKIQNGGSLFAIKNTDLSTRGNAFAPIIETTSDTFVVPSNVSALKLSAWGTGNSDASKSAQNGGYVAGTLSVAPGDTIEYTVGSVTGNGRTIIKRNGTTIANVGSGVNGLGTVIPGISVYGAPTTSAATLPTTLDTDNPPSDGSTDVFIAANGNIDRYYDYNTQLLTATPSNEGGFLNTTAAPSNVVKSTDNRYIRMSWVNSRDGQTNAVVTDMAHVKTHYYSPDAGFIRTTDSFTNNGTVPKSFTAFMIKTADDFNVVRVVNDEAFANKKVATGYGYTTGEQAFNIRIALVMSDYDVNPTSEFSPSNPGFSYAYNITVEPGQTKTYVGYLTPYNGTNNALTLANRLIAKDQSAAMLRYMSEQEVLTTVNFKFSTPTDEYTTTADAVFTQKTNGGTASIVRTPYYDGTAGQLNYYGEGGNGLIAITPVDTDNAHTHSLSVSNIGTVRIADAEQTINAGYVSPEDDWNNVVYSNANGTVNVYFNGMLVGTNTTTKVIQSTDVLALGAKWLENDFDNAATPTLDKFRGFMSDINVWNSALTQSDVDDIMAGNVDAVSPSTLKASWAKN